MQSKFYNCSYCLVLGCVCAQVALVQQSRSKWHPDFDELGREEKGGGLEDRNVWLLL